MSAIKRPQDGWIAAHPTTVLAEKGQPLDAAPAVFAIHPGEALVMLYDGSIHRITAIHALSWWE